MLGLRDSKLFPKTHILSYFLHVFRCVLASLYECVSVGRLVGPSVGRSVGRSLCNPFFLMLEMNSVLHENHQGGLTMTLMNVLSVLSVFYVLSVLDLPMDASLACWALFFYVST